MRHTAPLWTVGTTTTLWEGVATCYPNSAGQQTRAGGLILLPRHVLGLIGCRLAQVGAAQRVDRNQREVSKGRGHWCQRRTETVVVVDAVASRSIGEVWTVADFDQFAQQAVSGKRAASPGIAVCLVDCLAAARPLMPDVDVLYMLAPTAFNITAICNDVLLEPDDAGDTDATSRYNSVHVLFTAEAGEKLVAKLREKLGENLGTVQVLPLQFTPLGPHAFTLNMPAALDRLLAPNSRALGATNAQGATAYARKEAAHQRLHIVDRLLQLLHVNGVSTADVRCGTSAEGESSMAVGVANLLQQQLRQPTLSKDDAADARCCVIVLDRQ